MQKYPNRSFCLDLTLPRCSVISMGKRVQHFTANAVCTICRVTPRMLDYWITTNVVTPTSVFECKNIDKTIKRRRAYNLFVYKDLVRIKIVKDLRDIGVTLQCIRYAIGRLKEESDLAWETQWIITDGRKLFKPTNDPRVLESLLKKEKGQMVFSVIAADAARNHVKAGLKRCIPFDENTFKNQGGIIPWEERAVSN